MAAPVPRKADAAHLVVVVGRLRAANDLGTPEMTNIRFPDRPVSYRPGEFRQTLTRMSF